MITVVVYINDRPIFTRSARNISKNSPKIQKYKVDTGKILKHKRSDGFIPLVKQMLDTIDDKEI